METLNSLFTVLVNGVGCLVKTVRNTTVITTVRRLPFSDVVQDRIRNFILSPLQFILQLYLVHTLPFPSPYSRCTQSILSLYPVYTLTLPSAYFLTLPKPYSHFTQSIFYFYPVHTLPIAYFLALPDHTLNSPSQYFTFIHSISSYSHFTLSILSLSDVICNK